jgi:hypothetical protein
MRPFNRKSKLQRLADIKPRLPGPGKGAKAGVIAAGGLAALTAASAGISSLRRRREGASGDS